MSVPFSNTHLRVPRGFGTILEGLAREILRDQPEDIPKYAAHYFDALLKKREDSGVDPAEWAASLEDRFDNTHAGNDTGAGSEQTTAKDSVYKEESCESQSEDQSTHSTEASTQLNAPEAVDVTESKEEEGEEEGRGVEEMHDTTAKQIILEEAEIQPDEVMSAMEVEELPKSPLDQCNIIADGKDKNLVPVQDTPLCEPALNELLLGDISKVEVCAQELGSAEDELGDKETATVDEEMVESEGEEQTKDEEPAEVFSYPGSADVDVCAAELEGTERTVEEGVTEYDRLVPEEPSSNPQPEDAVSKSLLAQSEVFEDNHQGDQLEKAKDLEVTENESSSAEGHGSLSRIDGKDDNEVIKEDSLVEINFEDVPEAQQIKEVLEEKPEEEESQEVLESNIMEMKQEVSEEVPALTTDQSTAAVQDHEEPEKLEFNAEDEEMESQNEVSDTIKETVDADDANLNDSEDDEEGEGVKTISSSHRPTSEADGEDPQDETDRKNENTETISERESQQTELSDPDCKEHEGTGAEEENRTDTHTGGYGQAQDQKINNSGGEIHSSPVTEPRTESETFEASAHDPPEENEEGQRTLVEPQQEDTEIEKKVTAKENTSEAEGPVEEGEADCEIQEKSDATREEGSISPTQREQRPLRCEKDTTAPEGSSSNKEDCSRPQEEEDIMDIPLDDPEANRAAAKIQAGFRGHMTRKKMKPEDKTEGEERQEDRGQ
ncbi:uncharacterized protein V6R79_015013 [Siganus canaliculatus]